MLHSQTMAVFDNNSKTFANKMTFGSVSKCLLRDEFSFSKIFPSLKTTLRGSVEVRFGLVVFLWHISWPLKICLMYKMGTQNWARVCEENSFCCKTDEFWADRGIKIILLITYLHSRNQEVWQSSRSHKK